MLLSSRSVRGGWCGLLSYWIAGARDVCKRPPFPSSILPRNVETRDEISATCYSELLQAMLYLDSSTEFEMSDPSSHGMMLWEVKPTALFSSKTRYRAVPWQPRGRSYTFLCRVSYTDCLLYLPMGRGCTNQYRANILLVVELQNNAQIYTRAQTGAWSRFCEEIK